MPTPNPTTDPSGPATSTGPETPGANPTPGPGASPATENPFPALPAGEFTLTKIQCSGGAEIPSQAVTLKNAGGLLTVTGDDELKNRLLGAAPSLTLAVKDGILVITSTEAFPGYCGNQKPLSLRFALGTTSTACTKRWSPDARTAVDEPKVFENELRWAAVALKKGEARALTNTVELQGDFSVRVEFQNFLPGGRGAFFRMQLEDKDDPKFVAFAMVGNNSNSAGLGPMLMAAITNDGAFTEENNASVGSRSQPNGAFSLVKSGKTLTISAQTIDGKIERKTSDSYLFSDGRYRLKLEAGNNSNLASLGNASGINFTKVQIKNAAGAELSGSDTFVCDSVGN